MKCIIADAGPLIALSKSNLLGLLQSLYEETFITKAVLSELHSEKDDTRKSVAAAIKQGWICMVDIGVSDAELIHMLDEGEASAITYSLNNNCIPLLIDELRGKHYAIHQGIPVIGTAGVLILAKRNRLIPLVKPLLKDMRNKGYWLSDSFIDAVARIVDE